MREQSLGHLTGRERKNLPVKFYLTRISQDDRVGLPWELGVKSDAKNPQVRDPQKLKGGTQHSPVHVADLAVLGGIGALL